jgi:hypothetical protein
VDSPEAQALADELKRLLRFPPFNVGIWEGIVEVHMGIYTLAAVHAFRGSYVLFTQKRSMTLSAEAGDPALQVVEALAPILDREACRLSSLADELRAGV